MPRCRKRFWSGKSWSKRDPRGETRKAARRQLARGTARGVTKKQLPPHRIAIEHLSALRWPLASQQRPPPNIAREHCRGRSKDHNPPATCAFRPSGGSVGGLLPRWFNGCDSARTQRARPLCKSAVFCLRHLINHSLNDVRSEIGASCAVAAHANDDPLLSPLCVAPDRHGAKFRFKNQSNLTPLHPPFHYPL